MSDFQKFLDENLRNIQLDSDTETDSPIATYNIYEEIRNAVKTLRHDNHLTQKELAKRAGITQANLSNLEKGISKPTIESLKKIADATGTRLVIDFAGQEVE